MESDEHKLRFANFIRNLFEKYKGREMPISNLEHLSVIMMDIVESIDMNSHPIDTIVIIMSNGALFDSVNYRYNYLLCDVLDNLVFAEKEEYLHLYNLSCSGFLLAG